MSYTMHKVYVLFVCLTAGESLWEVWIRSDVDAGSCDCSGGCSSAEFRYQSTHLHQQTPNAEGLNCKLLCSCVIADSKQPSKESLSAILFFRISRWKKSNRSCFTVKRKHLAAGNISLFGKSGADKLKWHGEVNTLPLSVVSTRQKCQTVQNFFCVLHHDTLAVLESQNLMVKITSVTFGLWFLFGRFCPGTGFRTMVFSRMWRWWWGCQSFSSQTNTHWPHRQDLLQGVCVWGGGVSVKEGIPAFRTFFWNFFPTVSFCLSINICGAEFSLWIFNSTIFDLHAK